MMDLAQAKQIFWKEYRTQRSIWLGITLIIVVLQAIVYTMMPQNANNPLETLMGIGAILTTFYALASAGVLFAGEREEETDGWLMILPISRLSLVSGKVLWLLSSWVMAIGLTCFTAYLPYWGMEWGRGKPESLALSMLRYGGSMVAWGLFFSIVCRRVYTAIALATTAFLISASMIQFVAGLMDVLTVLTLVGSVVAGRRWLSSDRVITLPQFAIWADRFNLERALANSIESSPGWKMFRRQLWLEWRNARWVALAIFFAFLAVMISTAYTDPSSAETAIGILAFALLPLTIGFCTSRGEQYRDAYRFQSYAGASPLAVWCSKHLVWGSLLVLMTSFISLPLLAIANEARAQSYQNYSYARRELFQMLPLPENSLPYLLEEVYRNSIWQTVSFWLATICFMYAIGHVCSLLIKRSVSSLLVAVAVGTMLSVHLFATLLLDVPLLIAVGLPVVSLLLFTAWRTSGWLQEQNSLKDWLRMFAVLTLFLLICASSWTMWRMFEITYQPFHTGVMAFAPVFGLLTISVMGFFSTLLVGIGLLIALRRKITVTRLFVSLCLVHIACTAICLASVKSQVSPPDPIFIASNTPSEDAVETGNRYRELELLVTEKLPSKIPEDQDSNDYWSRFWQGNEAITAEQEEWLDSNELVFNQLIANTQRRDCAPENLFDINDWGDHKLLLVNNLGRLQSLLRLKALSLEKAEDLSKAWEVHQSLLNFYSHLSQNQTAFVRRMNLGFTQRYFRTDFTRWVDHPDQNIELLTQAASDFEEFLDRFSSLEAAFSLESLHQQWAVDGNLLGIWGSGNNNVNDWPVYLNQLTYSKWPMEQQRTMLMLQQIEEREQKLTKYLVKGNYRQFSDEIAADIEDPIDPLQNREVAFGRSSDSAVEESNEFWKLAATTPVIQVSQTGQITGLPTPVMRPSDVLFEELTWLRYQRLTYLSLALRLVELEGQTDPRSLDVLVALKSELPNVAIILDAGEKRYGQQGWTAYHLDSEDQWKTHLLYQDPIASGLFDLARVKTFLNQMP